MAKWSNDRLDILSVDRRRLLQGAAGFGMALGMAGGLGALSRTAAAQDSIRAQILQIPGVGAGSPGDADRSSYEPLDPLERSQP